MSENEDQDAPRVELGEGMPEEKAGLARDLAALAIKYGLPAGMLVVIRQDRVEMFGFALHPALEPAIDYLSDAIGREMDGGSLVAPPHLTRPQ